MKKALVATLVLMLSAGLAYGNSTQFQNGKDSINLIFSPGIAFSDFEGLFIQAGGQYGFKESIFGEFLVDYYFNPSGLSGDGFSSSAIGFNLNAVYKHPLQENLNLFGKAGINLTTLSATIKFDEFKASASETNFGINVGGGVEFAFTEQIALHAGMTFKLLFVDGSANWFKSYVGITYRLE